MQALSKQSKIMFVAVEHGGPWPVSLRPDAGVDLVVLVQLADEDPLVFARRLLTKVVNIIGRGAELVSAVFAVAPVFGVRQLESRCTIARALLRALRHGSKSELYLIEPSDATPECRPHLLAIAEGLMENESTDSQIRVGYEPYRRAASTTGRAGA